MKKMRSRLALRKTGVWTMVSMVCVVVALVMVTTQTAEAQVGGQMPNILVIWGDDVGQANISAYTMGVMGYRTPNIDRIAKEGVIFTDYYGVL